MDNTDYAIWLVLLSFISIINLTELGLSQYMLSVNKHLLRKVFTAYSNLIILGSFSATIILIYINTDINNKILFFFLLGAIIRLYINIMLTMFISENNGELERKYRLILNLSFIIPLLIIMKMNSLNLLITTIFWLLSAVTVFLYLYLKYFRIQIITFDFKMIKQYINMKQSLFILSSSLIGLLIFNFPMYFYSTINFTKNVDIIIKYGIFLQIMNFTLQLSNIICSYQCYKLKNVSETRNIHNYIYTNILFIILVIIGSKLFLGISLNYLLHIEIDDKALLLITILLCIEVFQVSFARILIVNKINNFILYNLCSVIFVVTFNTFFDLNFMSIILILLIAQIICLFLPIMKKIKKEFSINIWNYILILIILITVAIIIFNLENIGIVAILFILFVYIMRLFYKSLII
jgi:hypothetical protein